MGKRVTLSLIYDKCMGILMCANGVETKEKRIYLDKKLTVGKKGVLLGSTTVTIANPKASLP